MISISYPVGIDIREESMMPLEMWTILIDRGVSDTWLYIIKYFISIRCLTVFIERCLTRGLIETSSNQGIEAWIVCFHRV